MNLSDRNDTKVIEALGRKCDICKADVGELCRNSIRPEIPLPNRLVHFGRTEPA